MATLNDLAFQQSEPGHTEERFFFLIACLMSVTITAGFALNVVTGRSSFAVPPIYHLHAFAFFGWLALYTTQSGLVASGRTALHRSLGWLAVIWAPFMMLAGTGLVLTSLNRTGGPFFIAVNEFLFGSLIQLLAFGGLVAAAIILRQRTDWHRRLLLTATALLTAPGLGRLLPAPLMIPWAWVATVLASQVFVIVAMIADKRRNGRVHLAWIWGLTAVIGSLVIGEAMAYSPAGVALTERVIAGTPAATRPMQAYLP